MIDDPARLAAIVSGLGGTPVEAGTFQCDLPLADVRKTVPKIQEVTGLGCRRISERQDSDLSGINHRQSIVRIELYRPQEPSAYDSERGLMAAVIR